MTVTTSLKRLFLNSTDLTSEGAIAFAEFLPEARSLLHLDLTSNQIDISGVLALAVSVKLNSTIRCLDINIPPNDPDFSRLSQDILETCVRNTEFAQAEADGKGRKVTIAQPIMRSALVLNLEERQKAEELESQKRKDMSEQGRTMFAAAEETRDVVRELLEVDRQAAQRGVIVAPSELVRDALVQLQLAEAQLAEAFDATRQGEQRGSQALLSLLITDHKKLTSLSPLQNEPNCCSLSLPPFSTSPKKSTIDLLLQSSDLMVLNALRILRSRYLPSPPMNNLPRLRSPSLVPTLKIPINNRKRNLPNLPQHPMLKPLDPNFQLCQSTPRNHLLQLLPPVLIALPSNPPLAR